jgi:hypothetical protein
VKRTKNKKKLHFKNNEKTFEEKVKKITKYVHGFFVVEIVVLEEVVVSVVVVVEVVVVVVVDDGQEVIFSHTTDWSLSQK